MAVTDGIVVWVGSDRVGRALHPDAEVVGLRGAFVAPGFVDSHVHVTAVGLQITGLDLAAARSLGECLRLVAEFAASNPDGVVWGHGWDQTHWPEGRPPTTTEVDEAVGVGRWAYLTRVDSHSAVASSGLLHAAGQPVVTGGMVRAEGHHMVRKIALGALTPGQRARAHRAALDRAASRGVVAVHECAGPEISGPEDTAQLRQLDHGVDVRVYWGQTVRSAEEAKAVCSETGAEALGGDLFVDGSFGSHTAWLRRPYTDSGGTGQSWLDAEAVAAQVIACTQAGIQTGFHAIGDAALDAVVAGFELAAAELGRQPIAALGHRLEHAEFPHPDHLPKLADWGIIASVQPAFDAQWGGQDGMYARRLGQERAASLNPLSALAAAGIPLAISSDAPATDMNPWEAIRAAVHHQTPGFGLSPRAAFAAATRGGWRAGAVRDGSSGLLVPGAPASYAVWEADDVVVRAASDAVQRWSTDPRARLPGLPPLDPGAELPRCVRTVRRGECIYER